jgi:hypothetical protein
MSNNRSLLSQMGMLGGLIKTWIPFLDIRGSKSISQTFKERVYFRGLAQMS